MSIEVEGTYYCYRDSADFGVLGVDEPHSIGNTDNA